MPLVTTEDTEVPRTKRMMNILSQTLIIVKPAQANGKAANGYGTKRTLWMKMKSEVQVIKSSVLRDCRMRNKIQIRMIQNMSMASGLTLTSRNREVGF